MFAWKAKEFEDFEKTNDWFWGVGLLALVSAGICFWQGAVSFGIFILVAGFTMILFGNVKHTEHSVLITDEGLMIDQNKFLWKDITGFSIIDDPKSTFDKKVLFETKRPINPVVSLPINRSNINPEALKNFLLSKTEEKELRESLSKALAEKVRF